MLNNDYQLRYLESTANIKKCVHSLMGRMPSTACAESVLVFLQQGRMFLESAQSAPIEIRPLVLYYGIAAYAKAMVCANRLTPSDTLPSSHGLHDISDHAALLNELKVKVEGDGLFQAFNDLVAGREGLYYYHGATLFKHTTPTAPSEAISGQGITLKEVLSRIGGMVEMYERTFGEKANACQFQFQIFQDDEPRPDLRIDVPEPITDRAALIEIIGSLRQRFPALSKWRLESASHAWGSTVLNFNNEAYDIALELNENVLHYNEVHSAYRSYVGSIPDELRPPRSNFQDIIGVVGGGHYPETTPYLVSPLNGPYISELSLRLIGMFMLSSLVRYRPKVWIHSLTHKVTQERALDDHLLALIESFMQSTVDAFLGATKTTFGIK